MLNYIPKVIKRLEECTTLKKISVSCRYRGLKDCSTNWTKNGAFIVPFGAGRILDNGDCVSIQPDFRICIWNCCPSEPMNHWLEMDGEYGGNLIEADELMQEVIEAMSGADFEQYELLRILEPQCNALTVMWCLDYRKVK